MVKRATIHVSSRTKKETSEKMEGQDNNKGQEREVRKDNKYNIYNILQPSYPLQEKQLQHGPGEAVILVVYLAEGLYTRVACFVLAKLFHFMALFLAMA